MRWLIGVMLALSLLTPWMQIPGRGSYYASNLRLNGRITVADQLRPPRPAASFGVALLAVLLVLGAGVAFRRTRGGALLVGGVAIAALVALFCVYLVVARPELGEMIARSRSDATEVARLVGAGRVSQRLERPTRGRRHDPYRLFFGLRATLFGPWFALIAAGAALAASRREFDSPRRWRWRTALAAGLALGALAATVAPGLQAQYALRRARADLARGQPEMALGRCEAAVRAQPALADMVGFHILVGRADVMRGATTTADAALMLSNRNLEQGRTESALQFGQVAV